MKVPYTDPDCTHRITSSLQSLLADIPDDNEIVIVCVGTDRSTGDALGPLVGSSLKKKLPRHVHLFGTLEEPVHAMNLKETMLSIEQTFRRPYIIAVDACLGQVASVGLIQIGTGPVKPGAGVNKDLPPVGHAHITGIVNVGGFMEFFVLQNTRLSLVMSMAETISTCIWTACSNLQRPAFTSFFKA